MRKANKEEKKEEKDAVEWVVVVVPAIYCFCSEQNEREQ
jgi:hypothetical protein